VIGNLAVAKFSVGSETRYMLTLTTGVIRLGSWGNFGGQRLKN